MRRGLFVTALLTGIVWAFCMGTASAAESPADGIPSDALVYVELAPRAVRHFVPVAALPPVAKLFMPQLIGPFSYIDEALDFPPGTARQAMDHLQGLAFFLNGPEEPAFVLSFDEAAWPAKLVGDAPNGLRVFGRDEVGILARGKTLVVGPPDACQRVAGGDFAPLSGTEPFAAARRKADDAVLWGYVALDNVLKLVRAEMPDWKRGEFDIGLKVLGLDDAQSAFVAVNVGETSASLEVSVHVKGEPHGILALIPETGLDAAGDLPEGAAAAVALDWGDPVALFGGARDVVLRAATEADPNGQARTELDQKIAMIETFLGMPLDDFFALFGSGISGYLKAPHESGMIGREDWVATLRLRNPDGFKTVLDRLITAQTGVAPPPPMNDQGLVVHTLPMAPIVYTMTADGAVVGGGIAAIRRHLTWKGGTAPKTLLKEVPRSRAMVRLDTGLLLTSYPATTSDAKLELTIGRQANDLHATLQLSDVDPALMKTSPMATAGVAAMMAATLMPALTRARHQARLAADRANLHNIGLAIAMYSADHNEQFPPNLKALVDGKYIENADGFVSPNDNAPPMRDGIRTSYVFVGEIPPRTDPATIICYTRRGIAPEGRNVLCRDMAVIFVRERNLANPRGPRRTSLRASYDAVVKAYGDNLTEERKKQLKEFYEVE